jgi:histidyl-tRNA synthetase
VQAAEAAPPPDLYVVSRGAAAEAMALPLARSCRAAGLAVELDLSGAAFGKQFKRADRSGARWAAVIGEAEAAEGVVVLREMGGEGGAAAGGLREGEKRIAIGDFPAQLLTVRRERAESDAASPATTPPVKLRGD